MWYTYICIDAYYDKNRDIQNMRMDIMYRASDIARYIIERCKETNRTISNLKLQKILYFVQAEFLVSTNHACFSDPIEAWDFGPVGP